MTNTILLSRLSDAELVHYVAEVAADERRATARLVAALAEFDARQLYLAQGCSSLFAYCTSVLHLSEAATCNRTGAARAAARFPAMLARLEDGSLTLTAARLLAPVLTPDNCEALLASAVHKSRREIEILVATVRPQPDAPVVIRELSTPAPAPPISAQASVTPLSAERFRIQFTASRQFHDKLRHVQDLMRHAVPAGDPAVILERGLDLLLAQIKKRKLGCVERPRTARSTDGSSRHIPAAVRRAVSLRDGNQCAFVGSAGRCRERALLEFHHVSSFADGGRATVDNIQLRCWAHNRYEAQLLFGLMPAIDDVDVVERSQERS